MSGRRPWVYGVLLICLAAAGCRGGMASRRSITKAEPPLVETPGGSSSGVIEAAPNARPVTMVDRHPLLSKPREYYETSGQNRVVKAAAATVVGIPAGIVGELRQIVRGQPAAVNY